MAITASDGRRHIFAVNWRYDSLYIFIISLHHTADNCRRFTSDACCLAQTLLLASLQLHLPATLQQLWQTSPSRPLSNILALVSNWSFEKRLRSDVTSNFATSCRKTTCGPCPRRDPWLCYQCSVLPTIPNLFQAGDCFSHLSHMTGVCTGSF